MSTDDQWRGVAHRRNDPARARSVHEFRAFDRMAEALREAEQERLAEHARRVRGPGADRLRSLTPALRSAVSALDVLARRLAIPRGGSADRLAPGSSGSPWPIKTMTMPNHREASESEG
jgi:hypothetical protein